MTTWVETIVRQWREDRSRHCRGSAWQPHILIVDDDSAVREIFTTVLLDAGCLVDAAASGADAITMLDLTISSRCPPWDLVFMDLLLPGIPGDVLIAEFKKRCPKLPIVIVTGYPDSDMLLRASKSGYIGLIVKPFSHQSLKDILESHNLTLATQSTAPT